MKQLFELSYLGGPTEGRYRKMRPEVERLPWGSVAQKVARGDYTVAEIDNARMVWTAAAFQEYRTAAACAASLHALIAASAPIDLVAFATRFPLDEIAHVEMCARLVAELGAGAALFFDPSDLTRVAKASHSPLLRALELIVFNFCVGEALSIPMLRSSWKLADEPLIKAVLGQIVRDEAAHGQFGFMVLEWAREETSDADRVYLSEVASHAVAQLRKTWRALAETPVSNTRTRLGWMEKTSYLALAETSLERAVVVPLAKYGIYVS